MDHSDFIWDKVDKNPMPDGPPGETAREALERRVAWLGLIYRDKLHSTREFKVQVALDDLTPAQQAELATQNLYSVLTR
jgi:hypothetical protein